MRADLWFNGPSFLFYPFNIGNFRIFDDDIELERCKPKPCCNLIVNNFDVFNGFIARFSKFSKLVRIYAYILLYFRNLKSKSKSNVPCKIERNTHSVCLTANDLSNSEYVLISLVQQFFYPREFLCLTEN